jgi:hypothetical protein
MDDRPDASQALSSLTALFLRTWWMLFGNAALAIVIALMVLRRNELPSLLDAAFVAVIASLVVARLADIRYCEGATAEGTRATMEDFRRYAWRLVAGSAAGWGVANSLAAL